MSSKSSWRSRTCLIALLVLLGALAVPAAAMADVETFHRFDDLFHRSRTRHIRYLIAIAETRGLGIHGRTDDELRAGAAEPVEPAPGEQRVDARVGVGHVVAAELPAVVAGPPAVRRLRAG